MSLEKLKIKEMTQMKIRYSGKLYNTDKMDTFLVEKRQYGYFTNLEGVILPDGTEIHFAYSKFTNFDHYAYNVEWEESDRYYGSKQLPSGVVVVEKDIGIPN